MSYLHRAIVGVTTCALCACGDGGTEPPPPPEFVGLRILAGGEGTDTISTQFAQALVVELRDDLGHPVADHVLRFTTTVADATTPGAGNSAYISPPDRNDLRTFLSDTTDAQGRARVIVNLGTKAGPAMVIVTDPDHGTADTANFTVQPGHAARVISAPSDTTIYPGNSFTLRASVVDRAGNPRSDALTHNVTGAAITLSGMTVTAANAGVGRIISTAGALADTVNVSVVPQGVLAGFTFFGLVTINTDGTGLRTVVDNVFSGFSTAWSPSGTEIAFDRSSGPVQIANLTGSVRNASPAQSLGIYPEYSRDGQWLYYSRDGWRLYRVHPDGTGDELVPMLTPSTDAAGSPSPDGTRLAYVRITGGNQDQLWMLDLASGTSTNLNTLGHQPAWSPTGTQIAYIGLAEGSSLKLMNADGTGIRTIVPGSANNRYGFGIDWSSDGQWIVARNTARGRVELINASSGEIIPISNTQSISGPSWKP
jgi:WD40-like Beta Propeller Repeat